MSKLPVAIARRQDGEASDPYGQGEKKTVVEAYFNLGTLYSKGKGVPQDAVEAARLYRIAADEGHAGAQACLVTVI